MHSQEVIKKYRSEIFRHLDGIATAPSAFALYKKGVMSYLLEHEECELLEMAKEFNANAGYLNVALRVLSSQGWLGHSMDQDNGQIIYSVNERSAAAFELSALYKDAVELLKYSGKFHPRKFEVEPFLKLEALFAKFRSDLGLKRVEGGMESDIAGQVLKHIEGIMVGPTIVHLAMGGMFHKYFMETSFRADEFHEQPEHFESLLDMFTYLGWFTKRDRIFQFTEKGLFFARRASAYGVTVSYIPTFRALDDLIFGDPLCLRGKDGEAEQHVDREMNVWGSGGAHTAYFKVIDEILIDVFDRPIDEQPKGVLDMGCGNGAFIEHIFNVIEQRTLRGTMLEEHPLLLVGADLNEAALKVTRANLIKADIWAKVIKGDIGDPDELSKNLNDQYGIELIDLLNVRTFLDHNRPWNPPTETRPEGRSTGAFVHQGEYLTSMEVEASLMAHFKKWTPHVHKFGLLVIELHTLRPELTASSLGLTAATAYDATHGYSDQYILEAELFREIVAEAGLNSDQRYARRFPNNELATVTIDLFRS